MVAQPLNGETQGLACECERALTHLAQLWCYPH